MRILLLTVTLLALLCGGSGGNETGTAVALDSETVEWQRHACAICGKTIWEKMEHTSSSFAILDGSGFAYGGDAVTWNAGVLALKDNGDGTYQLIQDGPSRVEAQDMDYSGNYQVCPYCDGRYTRTLRELLKATADKFIAEAREKESKRRAEVAQENTQEELRRCEAQLEEYVAQVKKLTEKLEALKKGILR
jgi:hypothetical protein